MFVNLKSNFLPLSKLILQVFLRGFSSNKPLTLRINVLWGSYNIPHPPICCLNERAQTFIASPLLHLVPATCRANGHSVLAKSGEKRGGRGEEGAINFYNFLLSPKGVSFHQINQPRSQFEKRNSCHERFRLLRMRFRFFNSV